jgi:hypothetical protein
MVRSWRGLSLGGINKSLLQNGDTCKMMCLEIHLEGHQPISFHGSLYLKLQQFIIQKIYSVSVYRKYNRRKRRLNQLKDKFKMKQ